MREEQWISFTFTSTGPLAWSHFMWIWRDRGRMGRPQGWWKTKEQGLVVSRLMSCAWPNCGCLFLRGWYWGQYCLVFFYEQPDEGVEAILSSCVDDCTLQAAFNTLGGQTAAEAPQWLGWPKSHLENLLLLRKFSGFLCTSCLRWWCTSVQGRSRKETLEVACRS